MCERSAGSGWLLLFFAVKILAISCICSECLELQVQDVKAPHRAPVPCVNGASYGLDCSKKTCTKCDRLSPLLRGKVDKAFLQIVVQLKGFGAVCSGVVDSGGFVWKERILGEIARRIICRHLFRVEFVL